MVKLIDSNHCSKNTENIEIFKRKRKRKHIPHSERPKELVIRRNSKERQRAREVNDAFEILRNRIPIIDCDNYKLTRLEILKYASKYIRNLFDMIVDSEIHHLTKYYCVENVEPKDQHDYISKGTIHEVNTNINTGISTTNTNNRIPLRNLINLPHSNEVTPLLSTVPEYYQWKNNMQQSQQSYCTPEPQHDNDIHYFETFHYGRYYIENSTSCLYTHDYNKNQMFNVQCDQPYGLLDQSHVILEQSHDIRHSDQRLKSRLKYL